MSPPTPRITQFGSIRLGVGALVVALLALACNEPTRPGPDQLPTTGLARIDASDPGTDKPLGIGGSYTLNVSGPYVTERYPSPSGITLIPGIPVEVIVSGQITRQMTDGFISHCELLPFTCPGFVKSNEPFGPGGLAFTNLGAATSWWDSFFGWYYYVSPGGSVVYRGRSGTNLLLGRTGLYCSWGHVFGDGTVEEGDCYSMGGGFTYTVRALPTPPGQAGLTLSLANGARAAGSQVDLESGTTDNSEATDLKWYFIADNVTEETDPPPPPIMAAAGASTLRAPLRASRSATRAPNAGARRTPAPGRRVRAIDARTGNATITTDISTLPAGDYLFLSADSAGVGMDGAHAASFADVPTAPAAMRITAPAKASGSRLGAPTTRTSALVAAAITGSTTLSDCAGSTTCSANLQVDGGTFVVTGYVHGVLRVAEQRVSGGGGGGATPTVSCTPAPIERAASITCTTTGFKIVGKWTFTPDASNLPTVTEVANRVDHEWKGTLVAEGTVTVDGWEKVADYPDESKKTPAASFAVKVTGRGWKDTKLQLPGIPKFGGTGSLPDGPAGGVITWGQHQLAQSLDVNGVSVLTVTDGPNAGYKILTMPPKLKQSTVYLHPAIDGTSAWAQKQTGRYKGHTKDVNGDPFCTTASIALLKPYVERHEGLTGAPAPDSHWGIWQDQFVQSGLPATWEGLVRSDDSVPAEMVKAYTDFVTSAGPTAAQGALDARDNDAVQKGWRGGCIFIP